MLKLVTIGTDNRASLIPYINRNLDREAMSWNGSTKRFMTHKLNQPESRQGKSKDTR
jgi:hypothetical protein